MKLFVRILLACAVLMLVLLVGAAIVVGTIDKRTLLAPVEQRLERATGRELAIGKEPRIEVSLLPRILLEDVTFANAPWGSASEMVRAKRVEIQLPLLPLLSGRVEIARFTIADATILLETDKAGNANWSFGAGGRAVVDASDAGAHAAAAFGAGEVTIERADVSYRDGRSGEVTPIRVERLYARARDPSQPVVAQFRGAVGQVPVNVEGAFGPLAALRVGQWPWPVSLKGEVAGRKAEVETKLKASPDGVEAQDVALALGETRLAGTFAWDRRKDARALLRFDVRAQRLRLADLALVGAAERRAGTGAARATADGRLFPATPVSFDALRAVDARGTLATAALVVTDGRTLGPLRANVELANGRLVVDDLTMDVHGGRATGRLTVDAGRSPPLVGVKLDGRGLDVAALLAAAGVRRDVRGAKADVTLDLSMRGDSPRAWAASASGSALMKVGAGSLPAGDEGLNDKQRTLLDALDPARRLAGRNELACAVVRLPLRDGVARIDRSIAFETAQVGVSASGIIDLRSETLDLSIAPRARSAIPVDVVRLMRSVRVRGPLADPAVAVDPAGVARFAADVGLLAGAGAAGAAVKGLSAAARAGECAVALGRAEPSAEPAQPKAASRTPAKAAERAVGKLLGR